MRSFDSLDEREILALAIGLEEEDARIFADFADGLRQDYPGSAEVFERMREEEAGHRHRLNRCRAGFIRCTSFLRGRTGSTGPAKRLRGIRMSGR